MNDWLFLIPFLSAGAGWLIHRLTLRALFYPRLPQKFMGITFQGFIPRRQQAWAEKLGRLAHHELAAFNIEQKISDPANLEKIMPVVEAHIDDFLRNKLKEQMPMLSMFIGDKTVQSLKTVFMKEIETLFPEIMKQFAGNLEKELDIEGVVRSRIAGLPLDTVENTLSKELRGIAWLGAATGFLVGLIQVVLTLLLN